MHYNDVLWASWRLKTPVTWLFRQTVVQFSNKENQISTLLDFCEANPQERVSNEEKVSVS